MIVFPAIDVLTGRAVRLKQGDYERVTVYNEDPVAQAAIFAAAGAEWMHVVDLDGARDGVPGNTRIIERIVAETGLKVEVGGGIRSLRVLDRLAAAGVERMVLGTVLVTDPIFVREAVAAFGDADRRRRRRAQRHGRDRWVARRHEDARGRARDRAHRPRA